MGIWNWVNKMSVESYNFAARTIKDLQSFFISIVQHLNSENYDNDTSWIPVITGLTGSPVVSTHYQRFGSLMSFTVVISGNSDTVSSAITNLPIASIGYGIVSVFNKTDNVFIGHSYIDKNSSDCYLPDWSLSGKIIVIQGNYEISGI